VTQPVSLQSLVAAEYNTASEAMAERLTACDKVTYAQLVQKFYKFCWANDEPRKDRRWD